MNTNIRKDRAGEDEEGWDFPGFGTPRLKVEKATSHSHYYKIHFDEYIREPSYYRDVIQVITEATPNDVIELIINSPGGNLDSAGAIITAIHESEAEIFSLLTGSVHSAASMIALSCPNIKVAPYANMMVHQASFGAGGPSSSVYSQVDFNKKYLTRIIEEIYEDFLTPEEIRSILAGTEIWMDSKEIGERLTKMFEVRSLDVEGKLAALEGQLAEINQEIENVVEIQQADEKKVRKPRKAKTPVLE